ncbi:MAG: hypothetical protein [Bacteriophage sp.]|nr:MAG: hypothetical protein [Bacteriophage sp.]
MTTETIYTENIASIISPACANIRDMFIDLAGDYSEEYDTDKAARDYADCLTEKLAPLGITQVLDSGETRCRYGAHINLNKLYEIVDDIDLNQFLENNYIG